MQKLSKERKVYLLVYSKRLMRHKLKRKNKKEVTMYVKWT